MKYTNFNENENDVMNIPATVVDETENAGLMSTDYNRIISTAAVADKIIDAMDKVAKAALRITSPKDWTNISGTLYLQESGAAKVARAFGVSWQICDGYPKKEIDPQGYPRFKYRMRLTMGKDTIEAEGQRSGADEFFAGKGKTKSPDEIDAGDVERAAYTNCLNRGVKTLIPGLRNIETARLEEAGFDLSEIKGYTFKTGSKGGNSGKAEDSGLVCADCGAPITQSVASFSEGKFGKRLCLPCQRKQSEE